MKQREEILNKSKVRNQRIAGSNQVSFFIHIVILAVVFVQRELRGGRRRGSFAVAEEVGRPGAVYAGRAMYIWHLQGIWRQIKRATGLQGLHAPVPGPLAHGVRPGEGGVVALGHPPAASALTRVALVRAGLAVARQQGAALARLPFLSLEAGGSAEAVPAGAPAVPTTG